MIYDSIERFPLYKFGDAAARAFAFLKTVTPDHPDETCEIIGRDVYAMVQSYDTTAEPTPILEAHRKFIDIQYCLAGEEFILAAPLDPDAVQTPYDDTRDVAFYRTPTAVSRVAMTPGMFVLLFPSDEHYAKQAVTAPCGVKKVVVKLRLDLF